MGTDLDTQTTVFSEMEIESDTHTLLYSERSKIELDAHVTVFSEMGMELDAQMLYSVRWN